MERPSEADTIAAIATPPGEGGIGIVRLSGKRSIEIAERLFKAKSGRPLRQHKSFTASYGRLLDPFSAPSPEVIDEVLVLLMRQPRSYTCEDVVEIHAHGGGALLLKILELVLKSGARLAEKGEFTKRAFLNGRLDLVQAEAVCDLIKAKTDLARGFAMAQLEGALSGQLRAMRDALLDILSHLEASIDFSEEDIAPDGLESIRTKLSAAGERLQKILAGAEGGMLVKRGACAVIYGGPNVGKSSLMNCLAKKNRVIVTPYPGTTRDVVEEEIQLKGIPVRLLDTAGIHPTDHPIEREGVERSMKAIAGADVVLFVIDQSRPWSQGDRRLQDEIAGKKVIYILNKADLPQRLSRQEQGLAVPAGTPVLSCSCLNQEGIDALEDELYRLLSGGKLEISDEVIVSSLRQKQLLEKAVAALNNAAESASTNKMPDLIAVDVRLALDYLGGMVGAVATDDILDAIFEQFCVGK
jgi:tRNA modification GTPase